LREQPGVLKQLAFKAFKLQKFSTGVNNPIRSVTYAAIALLFLCICSSVNYNTKSIICQHSNSFVIYIIALISKWLVGEKKLLKQLVVNY